MFFLNCHKHRLHITISYCGRRGRELTAVGPIKPFFLSAFQASLTRIFDLEIVATTAIMKFVDCRVCALKQAKIEVASYLYCNKLFFSELS